MDSLDAGAHATLATGAEPLVTLNKVAAGRVGRVLGGSKADTSGGVGGWAGFGSTVQLGGTRRMFLEGDPTQRKKPQGGAGNRNKVGGVLGSGKFGYEFLVGGWRRQGAGMWGRKSFAGGRSVNRTGSGPSGHGLFEKGPEGGYREFDGTL